MVLESWAKRWNVSDAALRDLLNQLGVHLNTDSPYLREPTGNSEQSVQDMIRLEASQKGMRLWRNNVGATKTDTGSFIRFGLCNDTKEMNKLVKSSDLIGIRPIVIMPEHVGTTIGQFTAREIKRSGWRYKGTQHEKAQLNFIKMVASLGGDASFATERGTL